MTYARIEAGGAPAPTFIDALNSPNSAGFVAPGNHNPALDGLRFFAFMMVFFHHAPRLGGPFNSFSYYGWAGVDLFFVLSAYLLFRNFLIEFGKKGSIDISRFYLRRVLRIYPLLLVYVVAMFLIFGPHPHHPDWQLRGAGLLLFADNIIAWWRGYTGSIFAVGHLWTLSFEFQFYLFLPLVFFAYRKMGLQRFALMLLSICIIATVARGILFANGVQHPRIYVTPILRPEAVFMGLFVAVYRPQWHYRISLIIAVAAGTVAFSLPIFYASALSNIVQFPMLAISFGAVLDVVNRSNAVKTFLSWKIFTALGTISYGLYVIHYGVRYAMRLAVPYVPILKSNLVFFITLFGISVILAVISFMVIERPFLRRKAAMHAPVAAAA